MVVTRLDLLSQWCWVNNEFAALSTLTFLENISISLWHSETVVIWTEGGGNREENGPIFDTRSEDCPKKCEDLGDSSFQRACSCRLSPEMNEAREFSVASNVLEYLLSISAYWIEFEWNFPTVWQGKRSFQFDGRLAEM